MNPNQACKLSSCNSSKCLPFSSWNRDGNEYMQILNVAFLRIQRHLRWIRVAPYTWTILITWALCSSCGYLPYCLFSFSAKPSADLELVGLSLSLTTHAGLSDRLSKIPLGSAWSKIGPVYLSVESKVRAKQMNKRVTQNEIGLNVSRNCVLDPENRIIKVPIWQ